MFLNVANNINGALVMEKILNKIESPDDLKKLNKDELKTLCSEIREFLIDSVSETGGHLASNWGIVELTVAQPHSVLPEGVTVPVTITM